MRLDLKLRPTRFFQNPEEPPVPQEGVNSYLLEKVLLPTLHHHADIHLCDIDFEAFDVEDVSMLEEYYGKLWNAGQRLKQFTQTVSQTRPTASGVRSFC